MNSDNVIPFPSGRASNPDAAPPPLEADVAAYQAAFGDGPFAPQPPTLKPRRPERAAFTVRIELTGAPLPIWRRLRLASDLTLPQLHEVMQVAMGWTDSHLHHFRMVPAGTDPHLVQPFLTFFDIQEGDEGPPEEGVRLDQVLAQPGDQLAYEYDFGDGWWHTIELEKIEPWRDDHPDAFCLGGRNACPPEDVGGIGGYAEVLDVLAGKPHPYGREHTLQLLTWLPPDFHPEAFPVDEVNTALANLMPDLEQWHPMLTDLVARAGGSPLSPVGSLIKQALSGRPRLTDAEIAEAAKGYQVLLAKVGDGLTLTQAGYLPPRIVEELYTELDLDEPWIRKPYREEKTRAVLELRQSAIALGLLRKARGRLTVTTTGRKLASNPAGLLRHAASRIPLGRPYEKDAGALAWLFTAAGNDWYSCADQAGELMEWLRWQMADGQPIGRTVYWSSQPTWEVICALGGRLEGSQRRTAIAHELLRDPFAPPPGGRPLTPSSS